MHINKPVLSSVPDTTRLFGQFGVPQKHEAHGGHAVGLSGISARTDGQLETASSSPPRGLDYGGLFTKHVPLTAEDQAKLLQVIDAWKTRQGKTHPDDALGARSVIELLLRTVPRHLRPGTDEPEKVLKVILNAPEGQALGVLLQESIEAIPTATSLQEALFTALLLEVDHAGGQQHNNLASYSLRQQSNWGHGAAEIVKRFEAHLTPGFGEAMAKVTVFLLLSVSAPEFLVKGLPSTLVYGSHQWATFSAAVARIEASEPGSAATMSYQAVMERDEIAPVSEGEKRQQQLAQMTSVVDWAIANGVILEKSDDAYSAEDVERAVDAMQAQHNVLANSVTALSTPMPTRRALALAELRRVYGVENEHFFERSLLADTVPGSPGRKAYSLLDIYMSGDRGKHFWISSDTDFDTVKVALGLSKLKNIKRHFDEKFDDYTQGLTGAFESQFKYQLSLLPAEDRRRIEYGKVTTFELAVPNLNRGPVSADHKIHEYINRGAILVRADLDGKVCHYLYSPTQGRIIKDADPSRLGLQFPGSRLYFSMLLPDSPGGKEAAVTILWQALGTPWPKKNPIDFAAFSIDPSRSLQAGTPGPYPVAPPDTFTSPKSSELAVSVAAYFTRGLDEAKVMANGTTEQEREESHSKAVNQFFLNLIPFYSAVKSFIDGRPTEGFFNAVLDVFGFFVPGLKGGIQGARGGVKSGIGPALNFIKGFGRAGSKAVNPLAGVYDVGRGVFELGNAGVKKLRPLSKHYGSFEPPLLSYNDNIAEGIYRPLGSAREAAPLRATQLNGKWYAFDSATHTPYGAPLKGFISKPSPLRIGQPVRSAIDIVTPVGVSAAAIVAEKALIRHSERVPLHSAGFDPGEVSASEVSPAPAFIDLSYLSRFDAALRSLTELNAVTVACGCLAETLPTLESASPLEYADDLEAALERLEDRTVDIAQAYGVFCKPYNPRQHAGHGYSDLEARLEAIEKRVDAIREALTRVMSLRGSRR